MDEKEPYIVGFATEEAYNQFAELDCPELRELIQELRENPFPDREKRKHRVPNGPESGFFIYSVVDGFVYKITYGSTISGNDRRVAITAVNVQRMPVF